MSTKILRKEGKLIFKISIILVDIVCVFVKITTSKQWCLYTEVLRMKNRWSLKKKILTDFLKRAVLNQDEEGVKRYTKKLEELDQLEHQVSVGE